MKIEFFHDQENRRTFAVEIPNIQRIFDCIVFRNNRFPLKFGKTFMVEKEQHYIKKVGREKATLDMTEHVLAFKGMCVENKKHLYCFTNYIYDFWFSISPMSNNARLIGVKDTNFYPTLREET